MEIIIRNKKNQRLGLLVTGGYGYSKTERGINSLHQNPPYEGRVPAIMVTNNQGQMIWENSEDYDIVLIEGLTPKQYFREVMARLPEEKPKTPRLLRKRD